MEEKVRKKVEKETQKKNMGVKTMIDEETILILNKMMNIDSVFILREIKRKQALQQAIENTKELKKIKNEVADKIKYYENMLAKGVVLINTKQIIFDLKEIQEELEKEE